MTQFNRLMIAAALAATLVVAGGTSASTSQAAQATQSATLQATESATLEATGAATPAESGIEIEHLVPQIISKRPHDTKSFTEGLIWSNGTFYESSGLYGNSTIRQVDPATGKVIKSVALSPNVFGEGIALDGNQLIQLTWKEGVAYVYDVPSLAAHRLLTYKGEGWGLCFDGTDFYQSDGSQNITIRDEKTFAPLQQILSIDLDGKPVTQLNELECVGDTFYSNVWHTNMILRIDKHTGIVTGVIDASGLLTADETAAAGTEGVLNGIAYDPQSDTFFITGKLWPWMFEVKFVPKEAK